MPRTPHDVTDAELALMRRLWDGGPATIRQLTDGLYPGGGPSHYATVQKLLERLGDKGYVGRERRPAGHVFSALVGRDDLIGRRLRAIAETLCDGSLTPLLSHLVRAEPLSEEDRRSLRDLIDRSDAKPRKRTRGD
jgi:BlaI family penicillinase repressor